MPNTIFAHLYIDDFIAQILAKTDMDNVSSKDIAEFSGHVDFNVPLFINSLGPHDERLYQLSLQRLQHVLKTILIKGMGARLSLLFPSLIIVGENK